jgi:hypothetical protein
MVQWINSCLFNRKWIQLIGVLYPIENVRKR